MLASKMENNSQAVKIDFAKFNSYLLEYARERDKECVDIGDKFMSTSIFSISDNIDSWPIIYTDILLDDVERIKRGIARREEFSNAAIAVGYSENVIHYPLLKFWMLRNLKTGKFHEKQVDATVVALLVRSAIIKPQDYHCVVTGDADILPAIRVAYPEYSNNVFVATTHPDELSPDYRQSSYSISNFNFNIDPVYLQDNLREFVSGEYAYNCAHCHKIFIRQRPIPVNARPCCSICHQQRV